MKDNERYNDPSDFQPVDVSQPREVRRERDIIAEERREFRKMWFRDHRVHIFLAVGALVVAIVVLVAVLYQKSANPWSKLIKAASKDLDGSFSFSADVSIDDDRIMSYNGSVDIDRGRQIVNAVYDADYTDYSYSAAVMDYASGTLYDGVWRVEDCEDKVHDFFDFDTDYRKGSFDAGAFLRFTGLNTTFYSAELQNFVDSLRDKLSSESNLAHITTESSPDGTTYIYKISLKELFDLVLNDGAPVFNRSADYDYFKALYKANYDNIDRSYCTIEYKINAKGYLTDIAVMVKTGDHSYTISLALSDFGTAKVIFPKEFTDAAAKMYESEKK